MKPVLAWLTLALAAIAITTSCSINHRSGDFTCTTQAECTDGRQCTGGYCVFPGGAIDAPKNDAKIDAKTDGGVIDAPNQLCPQQCTSCDFAKKECNIDCSQTSCLGNAAIVCPTGWHCNIDCSTQNSCRNGINCLNAASCDISCSGQSSCRSITSGIGPMTVECKGIQSCRGINCDASCACDVTCGDPALCELITCSMPSCGVFSGGCTSQRLGCNMCP